MNLGIGINLGKGSGKGGDSVSPTVVITSTESGSTTLSPFPVTITFSENVTGFVVGDITVGNGTAGNFAGSGSVYTANITPTVAGTVTVDVGAGKCVDAAGNPNTASNTFSITALLPPTAAMGFRAYWQAMDGTKVYSDAGTTLATNGQTCQQYNESLGVVASSNLSQATAGNRPTFQTGGDGGKSRLFFDGAGDALTNAVTIDNYMAVGASTIVMALTIPTGYTGGGIILRDAAVWTRMSHITGNIIRFESWDTSYKAVDATFVPDTPFIVTFKHDTGKLYSKINDGAWSVGVTCGNRAGSTAFQLNSGTGDVYKYALALANVVVSDANIAQVVNYLKSQLGIA